MTCFVLVPCSSFRIRFPPNRSQLLDPIRNIRIAVGAILFHHQWSHIVAHRAQGSGNLCGEGLLWQVHDVPMVEVRHWSSNESFTELTGNSALARFTPPLIGMFCYQFLWPLFISGPMAHWDFIKYGHEPCYQRWWANFGFFSNWYKLVDQVSWEKVYKRLAFHESFFVVWIAYLVLECRFPNQLVRLLPPGGLRQEL